MFRIVFLVLTLDILISESVVLADALLVPTVVIAWKKIHVSRKEIVLFSALLIVGLYQFVNKEYWQPSYYLTNLVRIIYIFTVYKVLIASSNTIGMDKAFRFLWIVLVFNFLIYLINPNSSLYTVQSHGETRFSSLFYLEPAHFCLNFACVSLYILERKLLPNWAIIVSILVLVLSKSFSGLMLAIYFTTIYFSKRSLILLIPTFILGLSQVSYITNRFMRISESTDMSSLHRTLGMWEGFVYIVKSRLFLGVGLGQINTFLLYERPDFEYWYSPVLFGFTHSGINNGILYLFFSLGLLGFYMLYAVLNNIGLRFIVFVILYMASISNIFDVAFVLPLFVVSTLQHTNNFSYA